MYAINGVEVKKAYIGFRTDKLGYVFNYFEDSPLFQKLIAHKLECNCVKCRAGKV